MCFLSCSISFSPSSFYWTDQSMERINFVSHQSLYAFIWIKARVCQSLRLFLPILVLLGRVKEFTHLGTIATILWCFSVRVVNNSELPKACLALLPTSDHLHCDGFFILGVEQGTHVSLCTCVLMLYSNIHDQSPDLTLTAMTCTH